MDFENFGKILEWLRTIFTELINFIKTTKDKVNGYYGEVKEGE